MEDQNKVNTEERRSDEAKVPVNAKDHETAVVITSTDPKEVDHSKESQVGDSQKPTATITGDSSLTG